MYTAIDKSASSGGRHSKENKLKDLHLQLGSELVIPDPNFSITDPGSASKHLTLSPAVGGPIGHTLIKMINALKKLKVRHR